jgi:hypothetical protein
MSALQGAPLSVEFEDGGRSMRLGPLANPDKWVYIESMRFRFPKLARAVALICLLLLQVQAFAAATLNCRHAGEQQSDYSGGVVATACPYGTHLSNGSPDAGEPTGSPLGECQKCSLGLCLLGGLALIGGDASPFVHRPPTFAPVPGRHFYRFSPDQWVKPPIFTSS